MTPRKGDRRPRKYPHSKLVDATAADTHDGRPSLENEDQLLDALKRFHFIDKKGDIRARRLEPPALPKPQETPQEESKDEPGN